MYPTTHNINNNNYQPYASYDTYQNDNNSLTSEDIEYFKEVDRCKHPHESQKNIAPAMGDDGLRLLREPTDLSLIEAPKEYLYTFDFVCKKNNGRSPNLNNQEDREELKKALSLF